MSDDRLSIDDRPKDDRPNDYLWNGSGDPDPDVVRLEESLSVFRHRPEGREAVSPDVHGRPPAFEPVRRVGALRALAAAALVVASVGAAWTVGRSARVGVPEGPRAGWSVAVLNGAPHLDGGALTGDGVLVVGGRLVTDATSTARVQVADIGRVDVAPNSSVRLLRTGADEHRLALDHGMIAAVVTAPPRLFLVETPAALAVDLGCAYELEVNADGRGELRVLTGWVSLERDGRESEVPAGAVCRIDPEYGPGIPRYALSPAPYGALLDAVERGDRSAEIVARILASAPPADTLSLFHLLFRVDAAQRRAVVDAIIAREELPEGVDVDAVTRLDPAAIAAWREDIRWTW